MDTNRIAELANILKEYHLTKLDLTEGESRLVLEAAPAPVQLTAAVEAAEPKSEVQISCDADRKSVV